MKLSRPSLVRGDGTPLNSNTLNKVVKYRIWLVVLLIIVGVGLFYLYHKHNQNNGIANPRPEDQNIKLLSGSKDIGDKRIVISSYLSEKDYNKAAELAQDLAKSTNSTEDYSNLVRICAGYDVNNKSQCLQDALAALEPRLKTMSFFDAYTLGDMLDGAGLNKDRAKFYQRAYDVYDPARAQYLMTKEQLKAKIDELNK